MHPNEIPREYPGKDKGVDDPQDYTANVYPGKTGKNLKKHVVQFCRLHASHRKKSAQKANKINYFRT